MFLRFLVCERRQLAEDALRACGFDCGVFHVELKLTTRGPRLIEINARMGGGQVRATHLLTHGVDLVEETLFTAVGIPCRPHSTQLTADDEDHQSNAAATTTTTTTTSSTSVGSGNGYGSGGGSSQPLRRVKALAYNYVVASVSGVAGDLSKELSRVAALPGVLYAKPLVKEGDAITAPSEGLPTWVADVMVAKDTPQEALDYVLHLSESLNIPMQSEQGEGGGSVGSG